MARRDSDGCCRVCGGVGSGAFCDCEEFKDYVHSYTLDSLEVMLVHTLLTGLYVQECKAWKEIEGTMFAPEDHNRLKELRDKLLEVVTDEG